MGRLHGAKLLQMAGDRGNYPRLSDRSIDCLVLRSLSVLRTRVLLLFGLQQMLPVSQEQ